MREFGNLLDLSGGTSKSAKNFTDIGTLLHGDDTELILLVDPCQESLGIIMEDTSAFRPVTVKTASLKETVALLEQKVIVNKLLLLLSSHRAKRVVCSLEVTGKSGEGGGYESLNLVTLFTRDARAEREGSKIPANTNTGALDHSGVLLREWRAVELSVVHVAIVAIINLNLVVGLNDGSE